MPSLLSSDEWLFEEVRDEMRPEGKRSGIWPKRYGVGSWAMRVDVQKSMFLVEQT